MSLIPYIHLNQFQDGTLIKALDFCKQHYCEGKCKKFYEQLIKTDKEGFYMCPYGLSVFLHNLNNEIIIFNGFKCKEYINQLKARELTNKNKEIAYNPILPEETIYSIIQSSINEYNIKNTVGRKEEVISDVSHEVKKIIGQIKENSDNLLFILDAYEDDDIYKEDAKIDVSIKDIRIIKQDLRNIFLASCMSISRFMLYDYERDPNNYLKGKPFDCCVFKKFDKTRKIFYNYQKKKVKVKIIGSSHKSINAYPSFEMVPVLLIENAIKYCDIKDEIIIKFVEGTDNINVSIESYGPYIEKDEMNHIFEKGFRGKYAKKTCEGSGIGLFFVKKVCDLHNIEISAISNEKRRTDYNGIKYAPFVVTLNIRNAYNV